jgi:hypothetical protein
MNLGHCIVHFFAQTWRVIEKFPGEEGHPLGSTGDSKKVIDGKARSNFSLFFV